MIVRDRRGQLVTVGAQLVTVIYSAVKTVSSASVLVAYDSLVVYSHELELLELRETGAAVDETDREVVVPFQTPPFEYVGIEPDAETAVTLLHFFFVLLADAVDVLGK